LAIVLVVAAMFAVAGRLRRLPELKRETSQSWMDLGPYGWSLANGLALGTGVTSRIGFLPWYLVPMTCLVLGDTIVGATIFGVYGTSRGVLVWAWLALLQRAPPPDGEPDLSDKVIAWKPAATVLSAYATLTLGSATVILVGT